MSYLQQPVPRRRRFVPPGIRMRQHTYPGLGTRHLVPVRLGQNPGEALATAAPGVAAPVVTSAAGIAAGSALGIAIPVAGAALAVVIGALFAAHAKRVAGAKQENQVLNSLLPTVVSAITAVFQQANSGAATAQEAISALQQIQQSYWSAAAQVEHGPGQAGGPGTCKNLSYQAWKSGNYPTGPTPCGKSCTATCCIGCNYVNQWILRATWMFQNPGQSDGWVWGDPSVGNQFGFTGVSIPNWGPYTPPAGVTTGSAAVTNVFETVTGGTVLGLPIWLLLIAGGVGIWWATK